MLVSFFTGLLRVLQLRLHLHAKRFCPIIVSKDKLLCCCLTRQFLSAFCCDSKGTLVEEPRDSKGTLVGIASVTVSVIVRS